MQLAKWGNSFAIRLPKHLVEAHGLKIGDDLEVRIREGSIVELIPEERRQIALEMLKTFKGALPADYKFDREEANAR